MIRRPKQKRSEVPPEMLQAATAEVKRITDMLGSSATDHQPKPSYNVFISHNYADREHVQPLKELIESFGMRAYVDWVEDIQLNRERVTRDTGDLLRQRLRQAKCLIFLVSPRSAALKWMPWELGFAAGAV